MSLTPSRLVAGVLLAAVLVISAGTTASAHTDFESSTPADGDTIDAPVGDIVIAFTTPATPFGDGFTVLDPQGQVRAPTSVVTTEDRIFTLGFDPPLAGGAVGVRWNVQAEDAHPIEGSFSFTVTAPLPATTVVPTTTVSTEPIAVSESGSAAEPSLEEFLATETEVSGEGRQMVGRILGYLGLVGALGGLAFLGTTLRGTRRELNGGLLAVRVLGLVTAAGAIVEYWGIASQPGESFTDAWMSTPGAAPMVRFVGGLAIALGLTVARPAQPSGRTRALSAAVVEEGSPAATESVGLVRWNPRTAPIALVGCALVVASFWFDGHTVSRGPRIVHAIVNSVHVVAASVWAGGVIALAAVTWVRHHRDEPSRATEMIVRFSSIAAISLAAVAAAGALLAAFVLDSFGELTSTEFGQVLLLKTGAVALAAAGGAYNHLRLRPALEASPDDERLTAEFRNSLIAEAIVLTFVVVVTAWLVAAAT